MQILEDSMLGLRTARMLFRHRDVPTTVTLYPMVHVGEEGFYRETYAEAFSHDVTLVEGVRSPVSRHLTRSYRWIDFDRLGLVLQPRKALEEARSRVVLADLSGPEFAREWRKIPLLLRATFYLLAPLVGLRRRFFASRETIAKDMSMEDRRSADEVLNWTPTFDGVHRAILHTRDERLLECLAAELEAKDERRVAIVYGAKHMRAVLRELTRRGYYCAESSWQTIFAL